MAAMRKNTSAVAVFPVEISARVNMRGAYVRVERLDGVEQPRRRYLGGPCPPGARRHEKLGPARVERLRFGHWWDHPFMSNTEQPQPEVEVDVTVPTGQQPGQPKPGEQPRPGQPRPEPDQPEPERPQR